MLKIAFSCEKLRSTMCPAIATLGSVAESGASHYSFMFNEAEFQANTRNSNLKYTKGEKIHKLIDKHMWLTW